MFTMGLKGLTCYLLQLPLFWKADPCMLSAGLSNFQSKPYAHRSGPMVQKRFKILIIVSDCKILLKSLSIHLHVLIG